MHDSYHRQLSSTTVFAYGLYCIIFLASTIRSCVYHVFVDSVIQFELKGAFICKYVNTCITASQPGFDIAPAPPLFSLLHRLSTTRLAAQTLSNR